MVAASKLRKAQEAQANAKNYAQNLSALTFRVSAAVHAGAHPLLQKRPQVKRVLILVITSDKGLCGAFNNNANKRVEQWLRDSRKQEEVQISCCGKRGYMYFQKRERIKTYYENVTSVPTFANAIKIGQEISQCFLSGEHDEVYLDYNQFISPIAQKTVFEKILPIDPEAMLKEKVVSTREYLFEPPAESLLEFLIPHFLYFKIYFALLENSAGEHGARMSAMENATKNASELITEYTLLRNRARQAEITTELTEIVAGAEALK